MTQLVTVQMTVNSTEYYMSTEGYQGSNYYEPHIVSLPTIKWAGEGWIKLQAGQMAIADNDVATVHNLVGGKDNYSKVIEFASLVAGLCLAANMRVVFLLIVTLISANSALALDFIYT